MAPADPDSAYRLPTAVRPTHYELAIRTDLASSPPSFSGEVTISLEAVEDTKEVVFHAHPELKVSHVALEGHGELALSSLSSDEEKERVSVDVASAGGLKAGDKKKLFIRYEAELNGNMMGYYRSNSDPDESGKRRV